MIDQSLEHIVTSLGERSPTPGGGAAAAVAAAMGSALLLMVVRFSRGKKVNAGREDQLAAAEQALGRQVAELLPAAGRDCRAFDRVSAAYKLPKETEAQVVARTRSIEEAMVGAMQVPEQTVALIRDAFRAVDPVVDCVGKMIASDLGSGAELLRAAAQSAYLNVRVNAAELRDRELADQALRDVEEMRREIRTAADRIRDYVESKM